MTMITEIVYMIVNDELRGVYVYKIESMGVATVYMYFTKLRQAMSNNS